MRFSRVESSFIAAAAFIFLTGCALSSAPATFPVQTQGHQVLPRQVERGVYTPLRSGWISPAAKTSKVLYMSSYTSNFVDIFPQTGHGQGLIGQITSGMNGPIGMYVTKNGDLYVANYLDGTIPVFHKGKTTPFKTLQAGSSASDVTVDSKGVVYAAEYFTPTICVIKSGTTCTSTLTDTYDSQLYWIASDSKNDIFVNGGTKTIEEFPAKMQTPVQLTPTGEGGLGFDKHNDMLVCSIQNATISSYKPPYTGSPIFSFGVANGGEPYGCAYNSSEKDVWIANYGNGDAEEYSVPNGALVDTTVNGIAGNLGIALEPPGKD